MGWRRKSANPLDLFELLVGNRPLRAKQRWKPTRATLSLAFLPWALPSHLPLPLSFLQTPQKGSEDVSARAFSPVGEKSLWEAQLQAVPIWFCQLVWHAKKYLGLELKRKVRTLHSYLEVLCFEMGRDESNTFSWKTKRGDEADIENSGAGPRKEEQRWSQGRSNSRKKQTGWAVPGGRMLISSVMWQKENTIDVMVDLEPGEEWRGERSGCRLGAVKDEYVLQSVKEELKTETVAWGISKKRVKF